MLFHLFFKVEYQPSSTGSTHSPHAMRLRLQNPKWPLEGPKMADGVWKDVFPYVFVRSHQLSINNCFDPSTPFMRKGHNGGKKKRGEKKRKYGGK